MASSSYFSLIFLIAIFLLSSSNAANQTKPGSFFIPALKDAVKSQYYIKIQLGTPPATLSTIIDLTGQNLYINCDIYNSTSYSPLRCGSAECKAIGDGSCVGCNLPARPSCSNDTCGTYAYNPLGSVLLSSGITKDLMVLAAKPSPAKLPGFPFACSSAEYMEGLSPSAHGVVGLGSSSMGLTAQLASALKVDKTVSLCLPSSVKAAGAVVIGSLASAIKPISLTKTHFVPYPVENVQPAEEYYIGVKSVRISGQAVVLNSSLLSIDQDGSGGTKLSTLRPWTVLHAELYGPIVVGFVRKALAMKLKRVAPVRPFGACFSIASAGKTTTGPAVPTIELELESGGEWKIYGANSMVKVDNEVMCLGVVKSNDQYFRPAILIGGYQLQDNLLEFDQRDKTLRFSSSLLAQGFSCSSLPLVN